jgi:hypothetical protein
MKYTSATEETAEIERRDSFYKLLLMVRILFYENE